ncbi:MAG: Stp1/IreP family PP2C-type Ser/Thr phosphatase [Burkholderiales bacterium]|nr:Stp1/IreP family PP2C-type Ser/Thr phosphatase [Burkholderiales bacterium]
MSSAPARSSENSASLGPQTWAFAGGSDVGRERAHNEDAIYVDAERRLAVLADGMGGYQAGEVASQLAIDVVRAESSEQSLTDLDLGRIDPVTGMSVAMRQLRSAIEKANNRICSVARGRDELNGMGTTIVAARFYDGRVGVAHVGDSRCYRFRERTLEQLTRDHSYVQDQLEKGLISEDDAKHSPQKNLITRALGIDAIAEADVMEFRTRPGDVYLLCSDGLSDLVDDASLERELAASRPAKESVDRLIAAANANGGRDNISVILVRVGEAAAEGLWWQKFLKKPDKA